MINNFVQVEFIMVKSAPTTTPSSDWDFAIVMPTQDGEGRTVAHSRSQAVGHVDYMRLMATTAEALLDFCRQYAPDSINITESDTSSAHKEQQKGRIYRALLRANAAKLLAAGYAVLDTGRQLYIVRKTTATPHGAE